MSEMIQVPDGWEVIEVGKLIKVTTGNKDTVNADSDGIYPFVIRSQDLLKINTYSFDGEAVLIAGDGDIRNIFHYFNGKFDFHQRVYCLHSFKKNLNGKYFYYFFRHNFVNQVNKYSAKGTVDSVRLEMITKMPMNVPPMKEQEKIAKILSTLDKSIEATNRLIEKEKNIKTALMQELLTNGIDKDGHIRTIVTHTYKESELGLIPEEWEIVSLYSFFKLKSGDTKPEDTSDNGIYEVYGGNGITGYSNSKNNNEETLIIGRVGGYCGNVYLVNECWITDNALYITKKVKKFDTKYMFYLLYFLNLNQYKSETGQPLLNQTIIGNVKTSHPINLDEQKQIAKILTTQDKKIQTEETNLAKLKELKKGLMNDLLSGKVRVKV